MYERFYRSFSIVSINAKYSAYVYMNPQLGGNLHGQRKLPPHAMLPD